jgi:hypothetical protein
MHYIEVLPHINDVAIGEAEKGPDLFQSLTSASALIKNRLGLST